MCKMLGSGGVGLVIGAVEGGASFGAIGSGCTACSVSVVASVMASVLCACSGIGSSWSSSRWLSLGLATSSFVLPMSFGVLFLGISAAVGVTSGTGSGEGVAS